MHWHSCHAVLGKFEKKTIQVMAMKNEKLCMGKMVNRKLIQTVW